MAIFDYDNWLIMLAHFEADSFDEFLMMRQLIEIGDWEDE